MSDSVKVYFRSRKQFEIKVQVGDDVIRCIEKFTNADSAYVRGLQLSRLMKAQSSQ